MDCPVCGNKDITPFATKCSNCDADIVAYPLLDDLEEQGLIALKEKVALEGELASLEQLRRDEKKQSRSKLNRLWFFIMLLPLLLYLFGRKHIITDDGAEDLRKEVSELKTKNDQLSVEVEGLRLKLSDQTKEVSHIVEKGDNLSKIAAKYMGDANAWEELHRLNPHIRDARKLTPGQTIIIKLK